ncbi:hypothetical protein C8R43DRAFT_1009152 [Mycena crocata]|nr:hypothetical protein C8R43DRAFT_1009152 [Mycena crocata]
MNHQNPFLQHSPPSEPVLPMADRPKRSFLTSFLASLSPIARHVIICVAVAALVLGVSFGITKHLILTDVDDRVPLENGPTEQISLVANFLDVDATMRTVTVDWFPLTALCLSPELVVNIFADPNLMVASSDKDDGPGNTDPPTEAVFQFNTTAGCHPTNRNSFAAFRTVFKLAGLGSAGRTNTRSLQAYPYDVYLFQISMFAQLASTNASVGIVLEQSFGIPINFDIILDKSTSTNTDEGMLLNFTVSRSKAVVSLVILIVVANWLVTIAFLWITVAAFIWNEDIVAEMFVLPIGALFAFTSVRSNLPGAPAGFGAVVDYYGILPNLGLMTLFSAILLFGVLYRRIEAASPSKKCDCRRRDGASSFELESRDSEARGSRCHCNDRGVLQSRSG